MPRELTAALFATVSASAFAASPVTFPVSIPTECVALAQREHAPVVLENKIEAVRAQVKLAHMKDSDPLVSQCKQAVARLQTMSREAGQPTARIVAR